DVEIVPGPGSLVSACLDWRMGDCIRRWGPDNRTRRHQSLNPPRSVRSPPRGGGPDDNRLGEASHHSPGRADKEETMPLPGARTVLLVCAVTATAATTSTADAPKKIDFAHDILPILKARCAECHTNGKYKGSLSLDTRADLLRAKVVVPGKSAASELID